MASPLGPPAACPQLSCGKASSLETPKVKRRGKTTVGATGCAQHTTFQPSANTMVAVVGEVFMHVQ